MGNASPTNNQTNALASIPQNSYLYQADQNPSPRIKKKVQQIQLSQLNSYLLKQNLYQHQKSMNQFLQAQQHNNTNITRCTSGQENRNRKRDFPNKQKLKKQQQPFFNQNILNNIQLDNLQANNRQSRSSISQFTESTQEFRDSFYSDRSQTTIYLQPPEFVIRSPVLMGCLHKLIYEFMQFSYFIGDMSIKFYRVASFMIFFQLVLNIYLGFFTKIQCLTTDNNGIISLSTILQIDSIITTLVLIFLFCNYILANKYKLSRNNSHNRRRYRQSYLDKISRIITSSWIILYCVKFFILNSIESVQFFTYTMEFDKENQNINNGDNMNKQQSNIFAQNLTQPIRCSSVLNVYLTSSIIYNYISIVFLCVFVVEFLV